MILAAGLGTRLRPLTDTIPKALIEVGGVPMLERVAHRLIDAGAERLIINVHHYAEQIASFVEGRFDVDVRLSYEVDHPLETGGGLMHAAHLFDRRAPFIMHNADIFSDVDLRALYDAHCRSEPLSTLVVRTAASSRYLLFDEVEDLCGYSDRQGTEHLTRAPSGRAERLDFCGIHVISPRIFDLMTESGVFSIVNTYLRLACEGEHIRPFRADGATFIDIGAPDQLERARSLCK